MAVWIDKYIIFIAKIVPQNAYARNTGFLKSSKSNVDAIFVNLQRIL